MKKFFKNLRFKLDVWWMKKVLKKSSRIFLSYPVLVHLEFEKDWYYQRYLRGISVKDSVVKRLVIVEHSFNRHMKRMYQDVSPEVYHRLQRIVDFIEEQREINESIELGNKLINEYEDKQ